MIIDLGTGKSFSKALILASTNPQYDKRLFIDLPVQNMKTTNSEHVVYINCFCFFLTFKTIYVQNMFWERVELGIFINWAGNSTDNLLSYCGLVDARISAFEKDLPGQIVFEKSGWSTHTLAIHPFS